MSHGLAHRVLSALLLGALVLFVSLPSETLAHVEEGPAHGHAGAPDATPAAPAPGHCHPGLDCFVTVAFLVPPGMTHPVAEATLAYVLQAPVLRRLRLWSDPPPPRLLS